jgi:hypothetical protein
MFLNTLPANARQLLAQLSQQPLVRPFYLAGGSAAALHLGHRISVDLDFFTQQDHYEAEPLIQNLQAIAHLDIQQQSRGTLVGRLGGVRVSFFVYPYPLLAEPAELEGCRIARLLDIALMKLIAISQRGTRRDFVDLFFICQHGYDLGELLRRIPLKYTTVSYPSYHLLRALVYFADADKDESPQMLAPFEWDQAKHFFEAQVRQLTQDL